MQQGTKTRWSLKVLSKLSHSMVLWYQMCCSQPLRILRSWSYNFIDIIWLYKEITSSVSSQVYVSTVTPVWFCCIQFVTQGIQQAFILRITADSKDTMKRRLSLYEDERPVTDSYLIVLYNWPAVITFHFIRTIKHKFKDCVKWSQCWERTDTSKPLEKQFLLKSFVHSFHEVLHLNTIMLRLDSLLVLWEGSLYLYILRSLNANKNIFRKEDSH